MDIGSAIIKLRKQAGFSQAELAMHCELSQTYLSQIENNKREPHISSLKKISEVLDTPLPILIFLSVEESDIPERKRPAFNLLFPSIRAFLTELFPKTEDL